MNIGLNNNLTITCNNCKSGESLYYAIQRNKPNSLNEVNRCTSCDNLFTYLDGIICSYCSDHPFSSLDFVSDITEHCACEMILGVPKIITLKQKVPIFHKIFLSHMDKFYISAPIHNNNRSEFTILSSEVILRPNESAGNPFISKIWRNCQIRLGCIWQN